MPRGKSAREFALDLKKFGRVTRDRANTIFRKIILDLDARVVLDTPVDSGRARGNWFPSLNAPAQAVTDNKDKQGSRAQSEAESVASQARIGDTAWMTNNLPYILPLENGHSKQAPDGMVDVNLEAIAARYGGRVER